MSKAKQDPPATAGLAQTFELRRPIPGADGKRIKSLTVPEPRQRHFKNAEVAAGDSDTEATVHMLAELAGLPGESVRKLLISDARKVEKWLREIASDALIQDAEAAIDDEQDEFEKTFKLLVPIETDGEPITEFRLTAPDLGAAITGEKFKTEAERVSAIIAELSGNTIQVVLRLTRRDVARMEAWLAPFVEDTD